MILPEDPIEKAQLLAQLLDGVAVSVDVSTGDHDFGARVFGRIVDAQEDNNTGGVILLAEMEE